MQLTDQSLPVQNSALAPLLLELQAECENVVALVQQLQASDVSGDRRGELLSELLVVSIHLNAHCDGDWQSLISDEIEQLG